MAVKGPFFCAALTAGLLAGGLAATASHLASPHPAFAESPGEPVRPTLEWRELRPGVLLSEYRLRSTDAVFATRLILVKMLPRQVRFHVIQVLENYGTDLQSMTRSVGGLVGINANFFDESHQPLGLVIASGRQLHGVQRGGSTLTGVFQIKNGLPSIVHRDDFESKGVDLAVQAGPRLIANGRPLPLRSDQESSRRSGVAVTEDGAVLFFATVLRFPGASFDEVVTILLDPQLKVRDALNFDGGGSSQLFIEKTPKNPDEIFVHGGDTVPVGLVAVATPRSSSDQ